jgi:hypothetical protein
VKLHRCDNCHRLTFRAGRVRKIVGFSKGQCIMATRVWNCDRCRLERLEHLAHRLEDMEDDEIMHPQKEVDR